MATYKVGEKILHEVEHEEHQTLLGAHHQFGGRPICLCKTPGVEMYIAKIESGTYIVKRMPNSAQVHAPFCEHFEQPPGLSGLSEVMGSAIQPNLADNSFDLKFDFALNKTGKRPPVSQVGSEKDSVVANPHRLTLRGFLHFLWEEADFNKWVPNMAGKRNWYRIRKYLLAAADGKRCSAGSMAELLYMPEEYSDADKSAIAQRRLALLAKTAQSNAKGQRLMLAIGLFDRFAQSGGGHRLYLKHAPDFPLLLSDDIHRKISKRFAVELGLFDFFPEANLMVIATLWVDVSGVAHVDQLSFMMVTANWIPFDNSYEATLFEKLTLANRFFIKGLRYNMTSDKVLAACMLTDCEPPVALLIHAPKDANAEQILSDIQVPTWTWDVASGKMHELPQATRSLLHSTH